MPSSRREPVRFSCHQCGSSYTRATTLRNHLRKHTGERPHGCEHCGKSFMSRDTLRSHMVRHFPAKFQCTSCNARFPRKSSLERHQKSACSGLYANTSEPAESAQNHNRNLVESLEEPYSLLITADAATTTSGNYLQPPQYPSLTLPEPSKSHIIDAIRADRWSELFRPEISSFSQSWCADAWLIAAQEGSDLALGTLLPFVGDVNCKLNMIEETALHIVSRGGYLNAARALLKMNATVDLKDKFGNTPLGRAVEHNRYLVAQHLISRGADPSLLDDLKIANAKEEIFQLICSNTLGRRIPPGHKPLIHSVAQHRDSGSLSYLLEKGVDIRTRDEGGWTILHTACRYLNTSCVKKILEISDFVNTRSDDGESPLCCLYHRYIGDTIRFGNATVIDNLKTCTRDLISHGADVNEKDERGRTALSRLPLEFLLDPDSVDGARFIDCMRVLLEHGAEPNITDKDDCTILDLIDEVVQEHDFELVDKYRDLSDSITSWDNIWKAVNLLLEFGAMKGKFLRKMSNSRVLPNEQEAHRWIASRVNIAVGP